MKGKTKKMLLISVILVLVGLAATFAILASVGFDMSRLSTVRYTDVTYTPEGAFDAVTVKTGMADVRLLPASDGELRIVCSESKRLTYEVGIDETGALGIRLIDNRRWYEHIGIFGSSPHVTVYLPAAEYAALTVSNKAGDITLSAGFTFGEVKLTAVSGDLAVSALTCDSLSLSSTSGDLDLTDAKVAGSASLETTSGDVSLHRATVGGSLTVSSTSGDTELTLADVSGGVTISLTSGDIELSSLTCASLTASTVSGDVDADSTVASGELRIKTSSGDISLTASDAASLDLKTSSGDVTASLLSGKLFDADASSGSVRIPASSAEGGTCRIRTSSGDIRVKVID